MAGTQTVIKWRKPQTRSRWSGTVSSLMLTKIPYVCKIITCFLEAQFYSFYLIQTLELSKVKNDDMQGACGPEIHAIILWLFLGFEYNWSFRSEDNLLKSVMMYLQFLVSHGQLLYFHNRSRHDIALCTYLYVNRTVLWVMMSGWLCGESVQSLSWLSRSSPTGWVPTWDSCSMLLTHQVSVIIPCPCVCVHVVLCFHKILVNLFLRAIEYHGCIAPVLWQPVTLSAVLLWRQDR